MKLKKLSKKATIALSIVGSFIGFLLIVVIIFVSGTSAPLTYAKTKTFSEWEKCEVAKDSEGYWTITKPDDRDLKILQLTDVHIGAGLFCIGKDKLAIDAVSELVERVKPDLIIVTGDITFTLVYQTGNMNNKIAAQAFIGLMERTGVPWTVTFGNHDQESISTHSKQDIAKMYQDAKNSLFLVGDSSVNGVGNNVIKVLNSDGTLASAIFTIDSNSYVRGFFEYDNIHEDQVAWYAGEVEKLTQQNGGNVLKTLAFFHIPFTEYKDAWQLHLDGSSEVVLHYGTVEEAGGALSVPENKSSFFEKVVELGSTVGTFCGHDHKNYFSLTYKGVRLTYGMSIDYLAYVSAEETTQRGGTVITVGADGSFDCTMEKLLQD